MSIGAIIQDEPQLVALLERLAAPFRYKRFDAANFKNEFAKPIQTPIGQVEVAYSQFYKLIAKDRERFWGLVRPTLEKPLLVIAHTDEAGRQRELFIKTFQDKKGVLYFVSIAKEDKKAYFKMVSGHLKQQNSILKKIREGNVTYQDSTIHTTSLLSGFHSSKRARALTSSKQEAPNYITLSLGFPLRLKYSKNYAGLQGAVSITQRIKALEAALEFADSTAQSVKIKERVKALEAALEFVEEKPSAKPNFSPKSRGKKPAAKPVAKGEKRLEIEDINIADIFTDEENFQQRKQAYSERSVSNIIQAVQNGTFNWNEFDLITLWISPKDYRYYVLSGHSRLEAFRRLFASGYQNFELIPARVFEGTLAEAKEIALRSNTLSTKESSIERAGYYHKLFAAQKPRKEIIELAKKQESKNWKYIINLAQLNQEGALIADLEALGEDDTTNNLKKIADYIGEARGLFPQLTDKHETELYKYLTKNNRIEKYNKNEFLAELNKKMMFFDPAEPLNLESFVSKNTIEQSYDEALKEARRTLKEANEAREEKRKDLARKLKEQKGSLNNEDTKRIQAILVERGFDRAVQKAEQELLRLESQRDNIKEQAKRQVSLFGVFGDEYTQFKGRPKEAIKFLMKAKQGEAIDALYRQDIGYVSIPWGENDEKNKGFGLKHIVEKHGKEIERLGFKVEDFIPIVFAFGLFNIDKSTDGKIVLDSEYFRLVIQTKAFGKSKKWLLTAFDLNKKISLGSIETVLGNTFTSKPLPHSTSDNTKVSKKNTNKKPSKSLEGLNTDTVHRPKRTTRDNNTVANRKKSLESAGTALGNTFTNKPLSRSTSDKTKISKKNTKAMPPKKKVAAKKAAPKKSTRPKGLGDISRQFDKKPVYQMTFVEFAEFNRQKLLDKYLPIEWGYKSKYRPDGVPKPEYEQELRMVHRAAVKRALARKLEVPAKVLKAYPELTGKPRLRSRIAALKTAQEFTPPGERARIAAKIKELEKQSK